MIGLMILLFLGLYLAATIWVTRAAANWAERNYRSRWRWGGLAAFVMYNLVFWDFIPTLVAHKYYCETEAGFWVYKTPEQWKTENPGIEIISTGKVVNDMPMEVLEIESYGSVAARKINERLYLAYAQGEHVYGSLPVEKDSTQFLDSKTGQKLAELINIRSGYGNPMTTGGLLGFKGWLARDGCDGNTMNKPRMEYGHYLQNVIQIGSQK